MLYDSTKTLLRSILQSLESGDKSRWDDQIESGKQCLYEMHQMTRPSYRAYKMPSSDAKWPTHIPDSEKLSRAMPHVKAMVTAIRLRDHQTAIESGKAAIAEMNGVSAARIAIPVPEVKAEIKEKVEVKAIAVVVRQQRPKPAAQRRPVVAKRKARRASAAGAGAD